MCAVYIQYIQHTVTLGFSPVTLKNTGAGFHCIRYIYKNLEKKFKDVWVGRIAS